LNPRRGAWNDRTLTVSNGYNTVTNAVDTAKLDRSALKLLNSNQVEYLVIGGYAINYYGFPRATGDLDIWIAIRAENARA
jgi:hypothetical protein